MAALERADIVRALSQKGFDEDGAKKRHKVFRLFVNGKKTSIFTFVSRGSGKKYKTLGDDLVGKMAAQLKLTREQFMKLVECTLDGDGYLVLLRQALEQEGREL